MPTDTTPAATGADARKKFIRWHMEYLRTDEMLAAHVWDSDHIPAQAWRAALASAAQSAAAITEQDAHDMGAKGAPATEAERLLFEAWMRGHCWALCATWDGKSYRSDAEQGGEVDPRAVATRRLWAAWRDRGALAAAPKAAPAEQTDDPQWWRARADEIELQAARSGSQAAMAIYTDMRQLLQAASRGQAPAPAAVAAASDGFRGDTPSLVRAISAFLALDAKGALVPHGLGANTRTLLAAAASRLAVPTTQAAAQGDAPPLDAIRQAIRDYHFALDQRQHGGVAAGKALSAIESALGMGWEQGAEAVARAAKEGGKP